MKTIFVIYFSDVCLWCRRLMYVIKKKGTRLQSDNNSRIHISSNKNRVVHRIQKSKRIVKSNHYQTSKEGNSLIQIITYISRKNKN